MMRLTATTDATAGTCHDFNHVVFVVAVAYVLQQMAGIAQSVSDTYFQLEPVQIDACTANTVQTAHFLEVDVLQSLTRIDFIDGTQGGFHHTSGSSEDDTCSRRSSHRVVEFHVG